MLASLYHVSTDKSSADKSSAVLFYLCLWVDDNSFVSNCVTQVGQYAPAGTGVKVTEACIGGVCPRGFYIIINNSGKIYVVATKLLLHQSIQRAFDGRPCTSGVGHVPVE